MTSSRGASRALATLLALMVFGAMITACGGPAVIVRIAHARGETQVSMGPTRIVALGRQWIDTMSALDVQPVGYLDDFSTLAGEPAPWSVDVDSSATVIDPGGDLNAQIAELKPDLILASSYATTDSEYEALSKIAPTLPNLNTVGADSWSAQLDILGKIVNKQTLAKKLGDRVRDQAAALNRKYPNLSGETFLKVLVDSPDTFSVLASAADAPGRLLGMKRTEQFERPLANTYSISLPFSRIRELSADVLFVMGTADLQKLFREADGYDSLPAMKRDTILFLDPVTSLAVNRPSVLSMPYVFGQIEPILARADAFGAPLATNSTPTPTTEPAR